MTKLVAPKPKQPHTFVSISVFDLCAGNASLPGHLYLCIAHKIIQYKNKGEKFDSALFNHLLANHVHYIFVREEDRKAYSTWINSGKQLLAVETKAENKDTVVLAKTVDEHRRVAMDLFENPKDQQIKAAVDVSKKLVHDFMKKPYAVNNISLFQRYSKGWMDHATNVSVLSIFLGLRMGYTHVVILENLAVGGLLHDIGKTLVVHNQENISEADDPAWQEHPKLGKQLLDSQKHIPSEVKMIVAQHHEFLDGTGYPFKYRGLAVYDLARIVAIANVYDNLISESSLESIKDRATEALDRLEREYSEKLDPKKLEKAIKILRTSFL